MSVVYRFQDVEGRGPYRPGMSVQWRDADHDARNLPPFFVEFGLGVVRHKERGYMGCAFTSIEQARRWFTPSEVMRMQRLGYELIQMDVDEIVAESQHQCVFIDHRPLCSFGIIYPAEELWPLVKIS